MGRAACRPSSTRRRIRALGDGVSVTIFSRDESGGYPVRACRVARNGQLDEKSEATKQAEELFGDEEVSS